MPAHDSSTRDHSVARMTTVVALALLGVCGCAASDPTHAAASTTSSDAAGAGGRDAHDDDADDADDADDGGDGGDGGSDADGSASMTVTVGGADGSGGGGENVQTPVRLLPGLTSITFYETTNEVVAYTFAVDGPELTTQLADPLGESSAVDIGGAFSEFYDVYYSDESGAFDLDGSYLSISGVFEMGSPYGGGLNLAEIALVLDDGSEELGNYVASFVALGDNADPESAERCIDGDVSTYTTMGNTIDSEGRLRLTLGFLSTSGPRGIVR